MATKKTKKRAKVSKTAKRRAAERRRLIQRYGVFAALALICLLCLILIPVMNRPIDRQTTWTPAMGAVAMAQAPVPETPTPAPTLAPVAEEEYALWDDDIYEGDPEADSFFADYDDGAGEESYGFAEPADDTLLAMPMLNDGPVTLTLTAAGDCTLGGCLKHDTFKVFEKYVVEKGYDYFLQNVRTLFQSDDLTIVNLEGPLTDVGTMTTKSGIAFRGEPAWTAILTGSGVELCNFANNHNMDMGQQGFDRTLEVLDGAGLGYCVYDKVYRATIKGVRVTALGFDKWANKKTADVVAAIQRERADCDLLIVNVHWGREMHYEAMKDQKAMGHAIVDAGADLVIGTHPHVFGGVELYKGKYIAYSLGNFCFGGNTVPSDQRAMIFQQQFTFENGQLSDGGINIIPCKVSGNPKKNDFQPYILDAKDGAALLKKIARYSINLGSNVNWMPGSYPEQIGMAPAKAGAATVVPLVTSAVTPQPTLIPADQVFTAADGFDTVTDPQPIPTATLEPLNGLGSRKLTEQEAAVMQEQIYMDQMGNVW